MNKTFEDYFSEFQADMVSICLEYVEKRADKIFIYCSNEGGLIWNDYFYCINGKVVERHKLNGELEPDADTKYDVSSDRQRAVSRIINNNIRDIEELCHQHNREVPSEIKLVYDVRQNSLKGDYRYGPIYGDKEGTGPHDIAEEWFAEMQRANS